MLAVAGLAQAMGIEPFSGWIPDRSGMKAMTALRCRVEICRARNIFFLSRSTKRCNSMIFSFYHLQIVLLTTANNKIH